MEIDGRQIGVTGLKQVLRSLDAGELDTVYLAEDADESLKTQIRSACEKNGTGIISIPSKKELGRICGIEVSAACAGIRR